MLTWRSFRLALTLALVSLGVVSLVKAMAAQHTFDLAIHARKLASPQNAIRVTQGDTVTLRWTTDERVTLHLHGYDLEQVITPERVTVWTFQAHTAGQFAITTHGFGPHKPRGGHTDIILVSVTAVPTVPGGQTPSTVSPPVKALAEQHSTPPGRLSVPRTPQQALHLLSGLSPVPQATDTDPTVQSSVLCFCLFKGPATIREIRQQAAERFQQGLAAFRAQQYAAAREAFSNVIVLNPRETSAYVNRGLAAARMAAYAEALGDFTQAITMAPQRAEAYYLRGVIAVLSGQTARAEEDFRQAVQLRAASAS